MKLSGRIQFFVASRMFNYLNSLEVNLADEPFFAFKVGGHRFSQDRLFINCLIRIEFDVSWWHNGVVRHCHEKRVVVQAHLLHYAFARYAYRIGYVCVRFWKDLDQVESIVVGGDSEIDTLVTDIIGVSVTINDLHGRQIVSTNHRGVHRLLSY